MKKLVFFVVFFIFLYISSDKIILKDGNILHGKVIKENEKNLTIETTFSILTLPKERIKSIEKESQLEILIRNGDMALKTKDYEKAIKYYQSALKLSPKNKEILEKINKAKKLYSKKLLESIKYDFDQINEYLKTQNFKKALDRINYIKDKYKTNKPLYKEILKKESEIYYYISKINYEKINYDEALKYIDKAISLVPKEKFYLFKIEIYNKEVVPLEKIEKVYEELINLTQKTKYRLELAQIYFDNELYKKVIETLEPYLNQITGKELEEAKKLLSLAYFRLAENKYLISKNQSLNLYLKSIEYDDTLSLAYLKIGEILFYQHKYIEAKKYLQKAETLIPNNGKLLYLLGEISKIEKNYKKAVKYLEMAKEISIKTQDITLLYNIYISRSEIEFNLGNIDKSLEYAKDAMQIDPNNFLAYFWLGKCYSYLGKIKDSNKYLEKAFMLNGNYTPILIMLAQNYINTKNFDKAKKMLFNLLKKDPNNPDYHLKLADIYFLESKFIAAETEYKKVLKLDKTKVNAYLKLSEIYRIRKNYDLALKMCKEALKIAPNNSNVYLNMGIIYHTNFKEYNKAIYYYNKYYELGGSDPAVRTWIKECELKINK